MVKPIQQNPGERISFAPTTNPEPRALPSSTDGIIHAFHNSLPNLSAGGRPGAGSVISDRQKAEVYHFIQSEMDQGTRALSNYRSTRDPEFLTEARTHLSAAQHSYETNFSSSEGCFMVPDGNSISTYDMGRLNTQLNAASLALRRQVT